MRRTTTVIAATLMALSLAPSLLAQRYPSQDGYRSPSSYPNSGQWDRIAALAYDLENTAVSIQRQFERNNRRPDRAEARVTSGLYELNAQASRFRRQVEGYQGGYGYRNGYGNRDGYGSRDGYRQDRGYRRDDFAALEEAFFNLSDSLRYIRPRGYVDRGMDRLYALMNELGGYYGRSSSYGRGYSGRDRYGRDRDDGRYDNRDRYDDGRRPPQ